MRNNSTNFILNWISSKGCYIKKEGRKYVRNKLCACLKANFNLFIKNVDIDLISL